VANKYYRHQSVKNAQDASVFSDPYAWGILDILRSAGSDGITASNVYKQAEKNMKPAYVSRSRVYSILRQLYQREWIHRHYDQENGSRLNIIAIDWAGMLLDPDYDHILVDKERDYIKNNLFPIFKEFIEKTFHDLGADSNTQKWLPQQKSCEVCLKSHEADEFFSSVLDIATAEFMESKEYSEFRRVYGFAEKTNKN
jgi:hypothetical protein